MESKNSAIHSIVVNLIHDVSGSVYLCSVAQDRLGAKQLDCVFRTKSSMMPCLPAMTETPWVYYVLDFKLFFIFEH